MAGVKVDYKPMNQQTKGLKQFLIQATIKEASILWLNGYFKLNQQSSSLCSTISLISRKLLKSNLRLMSSNIVISIDTTFIGKQM